jgi:hypothetical protein
MTVLTFCNYELHLSHHSNQSTNRKQNSAMGKQTNLLPPAGKANFTYARTVVNQSGSASTVNSGSVYLPFGYAWCPFLSCANIAKNYK